MKEKKIKKTNLFFQIAGFAFVAGIFIAGVQSLFKAQKEISHKTEEFSKTGQEVGEQANLFIKEKYRQVRFFSSRRELLSRNKESKQIFLDDIKNNFEEFEFVGLISKRGFVTLSSGAGPSINSSMTPFRWFSKIKAKDYDLDLNSKLFGSVVSEAKDHFGTAEPGMFFVSPVFDRQGKVVEYFGAYILVKSVVEPLVSLHPAIIKGWELGQSQRSENSLHFSDVWKNKFALTFHKKEQDIVNFLSEGVEMTALSGALALLFMFLFTRKEREYVLDPAYDKESVKLAQENLNKTFGAFKNMEGLAHEYDNLWEGSVKGGQLLEKASTASGEYAQKKKVIGRLFKRQLELDESVDSHLKHQGAKWKTIEANCQSFERDVLCMNDHLKEVMNYIGDFTGHYDNLESSLSELELVAKNALLAGERGRVEDFFAVLKNELSTSVKKTQKNRDLLRPRVKGLSLQLDILRKETVSPALERYKLLKSKIKSFGEHQEGGPQKLKKAQENLFLSLEKLDQQFERLNSLFDEMSRASGTFQLSTQTSAYHAMIEECLFNMEGLKLSLEGFINQSEQGSEIEVSQEDDLNVISIDKAS